MKPLLPLSFIALAVLAGAGTPAQAHGPGFRHHHHSRAFIGLSIGWPAYWAGSVYYPAVPGGYVTVAPPPVAYGYGTPVPAEPPPLPAPIAYPRNGQSPEQTEADWRECNRWATTQPSAMADASTFQRAAAACMDAHGYSVR